jgi:phage regulator Rha-like protein
MSNEISTVVEIQGRQAQTTSLIVAQGCQVGHQTVLKITRKYRVEFEELGFLGFEIQEKRGTQGAPTEFARLNEDQATYLITLLSNTPVVRKFKLRLVKEFRKALNLIGKRFAEPPRKDILAGKRAMHSPMMDALIEMRASNGKATAAVHFINENRLCNSVVAGEFAGIDERELCNEDSKLLEKVRAMNRAYLMDGLDYETRKSKLQSFVLRARSPKMLAGS